MTHNHLAALSFFVIIGVLGFCVMSVVHGSNGLGDGVEKTLYVYAVPQHVPRGEIYDQNMFTATLQGIVNKEAPNLYVLWHALEPIAAGTDADWFKLLTSDGYWLSEYQIKFVRSFDELVGIAKTEWEITQCIVWDTGVDATVNVASTLAGIYNVPVLTLSKAEELGFEVLIDLSKVIDYDAYYDGYLFTPDYFGRNRIAYQWLLDNYLDEVSKDIVGYFMDGYGRNFTGGDIANRDLLVAEKGIMFSLSMWERTDPEDKAMIDRILDALGGRVEVIGFVPWGTKYSDYSGWWRKWDKYNDWKDWNEPGMYAPAGYEHNLDYYQMSPWGEWELVGVLSRKASYLMPAHWDYYAGNVTVHRHYDLDESVMFQHLPPTKQELIDAGYVEQQSERVKRKYYLTLVMADYDNYGFIRMWMRPNKWWDERFRNTYYTWNINPSTLDYIPDIIEYFYRTKSDTDYFHSSQTGLGYIFPNWLPNDEELIWFKMKNHLYFQRMDYKITQAFDRERPRDEVTRVLADIAPDGIYYLIDRSPFQTTGAVSGLYPDSTGRPIAPLLTVIRDNTLNYDDFEITARNVAKRAQSEGHDGLGFWVLHFGPSWDYDYFLKLERELKKHGDFEIVDNRTWAYLYRLAYGGTNDNRATLISVDNFVEFQVNEVRTVQVKIRNDGWNHWEQGFALHVSLVTEQAEFVKILGKKNIRQDVGCHEIITEEVELDFHGVEPGTYYVKYNMVIPPTENEKNFGLYPSKVISPFPEGDSYYQLIHVTEQ